MSTTWDDSPLIKAMWIKAFMILPGTSETTMNLMKIITICFFQKRFILVKKKNQYTRNRLKYTRKCSLSSWTLSVRKNVLQPYSVLKWVNLFFFPILKTDCVILFNLKKEGNFVICYYMDKPRGYYVKGNKQSKKTNTP